MLVTTFPFASTVELINWNPPLDETLIGASSPVWAIALFVSATERRRRLKRKSSPRQGEIKCSAKSFAVHTGIQAARTRRHEGRRSQTIASPHFLACKLSKGRLTSLFV